MSPSPSKQAILACLSFLALGALTTQARAQGALGYSGLPRSIAEGATEGGVKLSEDALMHVGVGVEAGYDSNVFYRSTNIESAAILRVLPFVEFTNADRTGSQPQGLYYDLSAALQYREYLTNAVDIRAQRAFNPTIAGTFRTSSNQQVNVGLNDVFTRMEDPPYSGSEPITRDNNMGSVDLKFIPGGGRLQALLRYTNVVDYFETAYLKNASNMRHELMLDGSWKWLPKTSLYVNIRQGLVSYFNPGKNGSFPLIATVGLRGLVTEKLSINLQAGYQNAFYSNGATTSGILGSTFIGVETSYRPSLGSNLSLAYRHEFLNSIIGNFYYDDSIQAGFNQLVGGLLSISVSGRWDHKRYQGLVPDPMFMTPTSRTDDLFTVGGAIDYHIRRFFYAGVGYSLLLNTSDWFVIDPMTMARVDANYTKQLILARLGVTY